MLRIRFFASLLLLAPCAAHAATAPTTPTFVLAWGGNGSAAGKFAFPGDAAADALGNVYVADINNNRIQKFDRLGNPILQWGALGSGNGQFATPTSVATDAAGNVYVADFSNHRIQKFTSNGAYLAQWGSFGTGNGQFNLPYFVATDAAGNVYVTDFNNNRVQKFTGAGAYLTKWGSTGAGDGQFAGPAGLALDAAGNVYVADRNNHRVQKFDNTGAFLAKWGTPGSGSGQFQQPNGLTTDPAGNVYVTELNNHRVQKFSGAGVYLTQWGTFGTGSGQFRTPTGIASDAAGNLYVADYDNDRIQKFSSAGQGIVSEPSARFLLKWGAPGTGVGQFSSPAGVATDPAGSVYVTDQFNHRVQKFSNAGSYVTQWGVSGTGTSQFNQPLGIAADAAANIYVADMNNHRIQKFTSTGAYLTMWGGMGSLPGQFINPYGVATDPVGDVYVTDLGNQRLQRHSNTGTLLWTWITFFNNPRGVATDLFRNIYVADYGNNRIRKFSSDASWMEDWGAFGAGPGQFNGPNGVATDAAGNVYVADRSNHRIQKFTNTGNFLTQWGTSGSGDGQFNLTSAVCTDASGNVFVVDQNNNRIQKFVTPPAIALVSDVGNDQGRLVQIRILRTSVDAPGAGVIVTGYEIYRRNDPLPGVAAAHLALSESATTPSSELDAAGWTYLMTAPAHGESEYNVVVPTLVDATTASLEYSAFLVRAATADPFTYYDSGVESGHSIDNLSPPMPAPFTAAYETGATHLHWGVSPAGDFATFRLYRGTSPDFVPDAGHFVAATPDTGYQDAGPAGSWYKLSAVDRNGNEGLHARVGPGQTTDAPDMPAAAFTLEGARPNPATGLRLMVHFALPDAAPASLDLLDVTGRRVRERAVGTLGAGRHAVDLAEGGRLAPGLYFVQLTRGAERRVTRTIVSD